MIPNTSRVFNAGFMLLMLAIIAPLRAQESVTMKKDVFVAPNSVQNSVVAFGGNVIVEGMVKENVVVFGGSIVISGEVGDSVVGIGSRVTLKSTAVVKEDVISLGGTLEKEPGASVSGDTVYFKGSEIGTKLFKAKIFKGVFAFPFFSIFLIIKLIGLFLWLLAALAVAALFPRQIVAASEHVRKSFWPIFGTGLLAIIIFTGLIILSALLCLVLLGIPILITLIFAGLIIKIFGRVVLFFFFGESLLKALGSKRIGVLAAVLTGLLLINVAGVIPFLGALFTFVLSIIGWGVALRTKFGTTDNWFARTK